MNSGVALGPHLGPPLSVAMDPIVDADGTRHFELSARCSLTLQSACIFIATMATGTFAVAGFFTLQGYWPVLPFAGLEIALLIWAVRASMRAGRERQIVTIGADYVAVRHYSARGERRTVFPRHWVKVKLHAPPAAQHPSRLMLESHGRACEVGRFLTEDERRSLAVRLKQLVGNVNESPALQGNLNRGAELRASRDAD